MAMEYDMIVVGAGLAGSSAAKAAAEKGTRVILIEEHPAIGIPQHCTGRLRGTLRSNLSKTILESISTPVVVTRYKARRFYAPSGKMVAEIPMGDTGCCLILRDVFDRELARQAANAGADIVLNTRVTGLLKEGERVTGVTTNSMSLPQVHGKVVVAADGLYSTEKGIPRWEGLCPPVKVTRAGIQFELARVRDIEPDVMEYHGGSFCKMGFVMLWPQSSSSCFLSFIDKIEEFERLKAGNYLISRKLKDAVPVRMIGYTQVLDPKGPWPRIVKDGLMLVGEAAGWFGIIQAILSGRFAGEVAADAIKKGDVSEASLSRYNEIYQKLNTALPTKQGSPSLNPSDETIENSMMEQARSGQWKFLDMLDI